MGMTMEPIAETAGFPFLGEGTRTQLQPCVVMLMALHVYFHHVWLSQLALCWAGFRSWEKVFQSSAGLCTSSIPQPQERHSSCVAFPGPGKSHCWDS